METSCSRNMSHQENGGNHGGLFPYLAPGSESSSLFNGIPEVNPALAGWAKKVSPSHLERVIGLLIQKGKASDREEAVTLLNEGVEDLFPRIASTQSIRDIDLRLKRPSFEKDPVSSGREERSSSSARREWQSIGTLSHLVCSKFFSGEKMNPPRDQSYLDILLEPQERQIGIEEISPAFREEKPPSFSVFSPDGSLNSGFQGEVLSCCGDLSRAFDSPKNWIKKIGEPNTRKEVHWLWEAMVVVYGPYARKLCPFTENSLTNYYRTLALLTWGLMTPQRGKWQGKALIRELSLDPISAAIHGGRVDAFVVESYKGRPLSAQQKRVIEDIPRALRRKGHCNFPLVFRALSEMFPPNSLDFSFCDWKFAVGDNPTEAPLRAEEIAASLPKEVRLQLLRYTTFAPFSLAWDQERPSPDIWKGFEASRLSQTEACFFFPQADFPVVEHPVCFSPESKEEYFKRFVVPRLERALQQRELRITHHSVVLYERQVNGRKPLFIAQDPEGWTNSEETFEKRIAALISDNTEHLDPLGLIKVIYKKDGKVEYVLNYPDLVAQIRLRNVRLVGRIKPSGFFISCLNPGHPAHSDHPEKKDINPSMMVYPKTGTIKCFSCGFWARLEGVPAEIAGEDVEGESEPRRGIFRREAVPEEHSRLIQTAESFLKDSFLGSPAEAYVIRRMIDPQLALERGAGFYNDKGRLVSYLKEQGFTQDQLLKSGILVRGDQGFYETLRVKGGRITFPLSWMQADSSLYGRCLEALPKKFSHRKLSVSKRSFPQGVSRYESLFGQGEELVLFEGVFDALTVEQLARKLGWSIDCIALIGTGLNDFLGVLAKTQPRRVGLALDFDAAGQNAAERVGVRLKELGFKGEIFDFNEEIFFPQFPEARKYDDPNTWLQKAEEAAPFRYPNFHL